MALRDLAAQFYLTEADVGRNRAEACRWAAAQAGRFMLLELDCTRRPVPSRRKDPNSLLSALTLRALHALPTPTLPIHAHRCREAVQELNTSVPVAASTAELDDAFLGQFQVCKGKGLAPGRLGMSGQAGAHAFCNIFLQLGERQPRPAAALALGKP